MPSKVVWAGLAASAVFAYRRMKACSSDSRVWKANFGEAIKSPDSTGAVLALLLNTNGIQLYVRCWGVDKLSAPRGVVLLLHGGMFHSKYFEQFAKHLVKHQFVTYTFDLQAHGLSGSAAGVRGDITSFDDLVKDTSLVLNFARGNHQGAPFFVYGESMGSCVALMWELEHGLKEIVDGFIFVGTMTALKKELMPPAIVSALLGILARICPTARVPNKKFEGTFDQAFGDPSAAAAARKDPLVIFLPPTIRFMCQGLECLKKIDSSLGQVVSPFIALHGLEDCRCDWQDSQRLFDEASSEDKTIKLYEGMHHQLLQELPEAQERVFGDIVEWLNDRTAELPQKSASQSAEFNLPEYSFPSKR